MPPDIQEIERRLVQIAALIERQRRLVAAMRDHGLPAEAPTRLLASMLRHSRMLEQQRDQMRRVSAPNAPAGARAVSRQ